MVAITLPPTILGIKTIGMGTVICAIFLDIKVYIKLFTTSLLRRISLAVQG